MFKNKPRSGDNFYLKDCIPKVLTSGVAYKFHWGLCSESYYGECVRQLNIRIGEHIGISQLMKNKIKFKNSFAADHFSVLMREKKFFYKKVKTVC